MLAALTSPDPPRGRRPTPTTRRSAPGRCCCTPPSAVPETAVVCATRGEAGEVEPGRRRPDRRCRRLREGELRDAAAALDVAGVELLGFADSGLTGDAGPDTLVGADPGGRRGCRARRSSSVTPRTSWSPSTPRRPPRPRAVRDATLAAVDAAGLASTRVYLHCLPTSIMDRWVGHMQRHRPVVGAPRARRARHPRRAGDHGDRHPAAPRPTGGGDGGAPLPALAVRGPAAGAVRGVPRPRAPDPGAPGLARWPRGDRPSSSAATAPA